MRVLRLTRSGNQDVALLEARAAPSLSLLAAWTSDGERWRLSPVLRTGGPAAVSASFGDGGTGVVLSGNRGATISGPGSSWRRLPALPAGRTVTLALPARRRDRGTGRGRWHADDLEAGRATRAPG